MKKEPRGLLRVRLSDAVPTPTEPEIPTGGGKNRRRTKGNVSEAAIHQQNTQINAGLKSNKERLVEIGRGDQTAGRQGGS